VIDKGLILIKGIIALQNRWKVEGTTIQHFFFLFPGSLFLFDAVSFQFLICSQQQGNVEK
jgi:hypothetical protein